MGVSVATTKRPSAISWSGVFRVLSFLFSSVMLWQTCGDGRVPAFLSPTVERTLYFKLPIRTSYHWIFLDRRAFLSGELTLRIVNAARGRDQTLVIFRDGLITDGWQMIDGTGREGGFYFGLSTDKRFATSVGDSVIVTLKAAEDLRGRGPYAQGTLAKGTWVATGTYSSLFGGTLNPFRDLVRAGLPPVAFLECWDTAWALRDVSADGWMARKQAEETRLKRWARHRYNRGVDGRHCQSPR